MAAAWVGRQLPSVFKKVQVVSVGLLRSSIRAISDRLWFSNQSGNLPGGATTKVDALEAG
ncbi:hypothetical protein [Nostoc sp.]